jgi:CBS domain-containing protein
VHPGASLTEALEQFTEHDGERLPVITESGSTLLGSVSKTDVILALAGSHRSPGAVRTDLGQ